MPRWKETPLEKRAYAMRLDPSTGAWSKCWYRDLRKGDVFRAFACDGRQMDPTGEYGEAVDENFVALAVGDPVHSTEDFYPDGVPEEIEDANAGWAVPVITGRFPDILREVAH